MVGLPVDENGEDIDPFDSSSNNAYFQSNQHTKDLMLKILKKIEGEMEDKNKMNEFHRGWVNEAYTPSQKKA